MIPESQRDFTNWLAYHNRTHAEAQLEEPIAWEIYRTYYPCNCESCAQRKRLGHPPFRLSGRADCTAPMEPIDLAFVRSYLGVSR